MKLRQFNERLPILLLLIGLLNSYYNIIISQFFNYTLANFVSNRRILIIVSSFVWVK